MKCPKCGAENPDDAQVCKSCGSVLTNTPTQTSALTPKTSGLAIASFVLGILSFCTFFITSIPAIILGIIGLVKIRKSNGKLTGNSFAITGIVLALMIPYLMHTQRMVFRMHCGTNMAQLGMAMLIYTNDYEDKFPTPSKWCDLIIKYPDIKPSMLHCKGSPGGPCNYAINKNIEKSGTSSPSDMVLLFETHSGWNQAGGPEILSTDNHKGDGCNVLFADGHVDFVKAQDLHKLRWKPD